MLAPWLMAFCGFFAGETGARGGLDNDATQVALMRLGTTTVLSMQNAYRGPPAAFALVVLVPAVVQCCRRRSPKRAGWATRSRSAARRSRSPARGKRVVVAADLDDTACPNGLDCNAGAVYVITLP